MKTLIAVRSGGSASVLAPPAEATSTMPMLMGMGAAFDSWTEVSNEAEGRFLERVGEGAFRATIAKDRAAIRILLDHGQDVFTGRKPLAPLGDPCRGPERSVYGGSLFDTSYNRDLLPGLRAGLYGNSVRWQVSKEEYRAHPGRSELNPAGLPERTVREVRLIELGPTLFPVYKSTSAAARATATNPTYKPVSMDAFVRALGRR